MSLLLDFIVVAAFGFSLWRGLRRGFIRSVMGVIVVVLSLLGAAKLTPPLAAYLSDRYIDKAITAQVEDSLDDIVSENLNLDTLFDTAPQAFLNILDRFDADFDELKAYYEADASNDEDAEGSLSSYIAAPLSQTISRAAAFALLFIGLYLTLSLVALLINLVVRLPLLKTANRLLGAVLGALIGLCLAWGLSVAFCELLPELSKVYEDVSANLIDHTILVKYLGGLDVMNLF